MRVVGCKRTLAPCPFVDQVYDRSEMAAMFAEADHAAIAAPLTADTDGLLGLAELQTLKPGAILVNVSRGPVVQEKALIEVLRNGQLGGAALDVFAVEPLPKEHPFWSMPNVLVSPHFSGETVNNSNLPAKRFLRNLRAYLQGDLQEGLVDLTLGY
jgi:phosphoglycerate dehydrogenase-like enzyme